MTTNKEIITVVEEKHTYKLKTVECERCHKYDQVMFEEGETRTIHICVHCDRHSFEDLED